MTTRCDRTRWYDDRPELSKAIRLLAAMPTEIQTIIGNGIWELADRECHVSELEKSFRSMGRDKIMGLYKSAQKRRWFDQNPAMYRAVNCLYILSPDKQEFMGTKILELMGYIAQYFNICDKFDNEPDIAQVGEVTQRYVERGNIEVQMFLIQLVKVFETALKGGTIIESKLTGNVVKDHSQGMKVSEG